MPSILPSPPNRILVVRPSALGDVCRSVPLVASLRRAFPAARIDWVVQKGFEGAVEAHPGLLAKGGGVVLFDRKRFGKWTNLSAQMDLLRWLKGLRAARYDLVIDAQGLLRSGLITRATGAPVRVGFADAREGGAIGYTHKVSVSEGMHTVDQMLALLPPLGVEPVKDLRLYSKREEQQAATEMVGEGHYAVLAPTSRWASKQWPDARYVEVAKELLGKLGFERVVIVGGPGEDAQVPALCAWAAGEKRAVNLIGKTSVPRLMAVIEGCGLLIGSDSAAVHMAVGFDRPCVALYGPTDVARVGPARGVTSTAQTVVVQKVPPGEAPAFGAHKQAEPGKTYMSKITTGDVIDAACCATR
ncbi:MAG: glycosyltransferase family 9 protein [Phycisphaerales bacterium]